MGVTNDTVPFNQIQGIASTNVPAYSNGGDDFFSVERHYLHGIFTGFKWQCVEYARRWLLLRKSCVFRDIGTAAAIFNELTTIERVTDGQNFPLKACKNGSAHEPKVDSFLIYSKSSEQPFGHIATITEVGPGFIRIAEQNNSFHYWPGDYSRQIPLVCKQGLYYIEDEEDEVCGWMEIEDDNQLQPFDESKVKSILTQYQDIRPMGTLERCFIPGESVPVLDTPWLDKDDPAEKFFMSIYGEDLRRANLESLPYYKADKDFILTLSGTSNELHRMFMEASNKVIQSDELMERFGIPQVFWSRIRHSWATEQGSTISGRFDLAFDGKKLKVFEYNADSAATLLETAIIQEKWAKAVNLTSTWMSGFQINRTLVKQWKNLKIEKRVHLLMDGDENGDEDELLTAFYMQHVLKEADIDQKLCKGLNDLYWKDSKIVDSDNKPVEIVWKLWMWETIFQDYLEAQKERKGTNAWQPVNGEHPRLSDILLNDHIKVIEPLWKVVTSNKALLPVLWSMYPNHPNLLKSEWTLTDDLKQHAFVKKPIVGRCGQNVTLYNPNGDSVIDETNGKFVDRDSIYQELFPMVNHDGYYAVIGSWILYGLFTGFCIREDKKLISDVDSNITACCIVWK